MINTKIKHLQSSYEFVQQEVNKSLRNKCHHILIPISISGDNNKMTEELFDEYKHEIDFLIENNELYNLNSEARELFYSGTNLDGFSMAVYLKTKEIFERYNSDPEQDFD